VPTPGGPESKLRSIAVTLFVVSVAVYVSVHLIVAVAPVLVALGAAAAVITTIGVIIRRRRW
jgi:uncharacterized membrane protein (DUF485 family)